LLTSFLGFHFIVESSISALQDCHISKKKNIALEVVYYPSPNWCDIVVDVKSVDDAMKIVVKLSFKTEKSLKKTFSASGDNL